MNLFSWHGLSLCSTVVDAVLAGLFQTVAAGLADRLATALVFVVGGHISDRRVQPDRVVLKPYSVQLEFEFAGVADLLQVWPRPPFTCPNRVSIQAWSVGVDGRPNCCAMASRP